STGWTMPRPRSRCHRRLGIVRGKRPVSGGGTSRARCSRRLAFGSLGAVGPQSGDRNRGGGLLSVGVWQRWGSRGWAAVAGRQGVSLFQLPLVDEAVVAGGALQVDPEEHLGDVLGKLDLPHLAGVDPAAPLDAIDKSLRIRRGADQLADEPVVGLVVQERPV